MIDEEKRKRLVNAGIAAVVIIFLLIFVNTFFFSGKKESKENKRIPKEDYVYTTTSKEVGSSGVSSTLPIVNLNGSDALQVNEILETAYEEALKEKYAQFTYEYQTSGDYLSLVTMTHRVAENNPYPRTTIETYTFNIKTTALLSDEELLSTFGYTWEDIRESFSKNLNTYYKEGVEQGFVLGTECDFACFLERREIDDYIEDAHLFVKNKQLMYYRPFVVYTVMGEENYYEKIGEDFLFEID